MTHNTLMPTDNTCPPARVALLKRPILPGQCREGVRPVSYKPHTSHKDTLTAFLRSLAGDVAYIHTPRIFFDLTRDIGVAAMLSQLIYWSDRAVRADGFVYKSSRSWYEEVGASRYAVQKFNQLPFVITKVLYANGSPTTHYRIDMEKLFESLKALCPNDCPPSDGPLPENAQSTVSFQTIDEPISNIPLSENAQSIDPFQTIDMPISNIPLSENEQSLTDTTTHTTTHTTTDITTLKEGPPFFFNHPAFSDGHLENQVSQTEANPKNAPPSAAESDPAQFKLFLEALAHITGCDLAIKKTAARLLLAARQLVGAGYTIPDLDNFLDYWKASDWRWQKDHQLPTPEDVLFNISRSKYYHQNKRKRWLGQE